MNSSTEENETPAACEFDDHLEILRGIDFFAGLPMELLKVLAYLCECTTYRVGEDLFLQGENDGCAYYIQTGTTQLSHSVDGKQVVVKNYPAPVFLGGLSLLGPIPRHFSLKALSDVSSLILKRKKFTRAIEQFPDVKSKILLSVVRRIDQWERQMLTESSDSINVCAANIGISLI